MNADHSDHTQLAAYNHMQYSNDALNSEDLCDE